LYARTERRLAPALMLTTDLAEATRQAEVVLITVPDSAITSVAQALADAHAIDKAQVVLHVSGLLDRKALSPLDGAGAGLGSLHPLQSIADPATAADRLNGVYAALEGDNRAIEAGERLARTLRMIPVMVEASSKPLYHAGATIIANYTVTLMGMAERLAIRAGVPADIAGKLYAPLLKGAAENIATMGSLGALTGPVRRGDVTTVEAHLATLEGDERRLYAALGLEALVLARQAGLDDDLARKVELALLPAREEGSTPVRKRVVTVR
jgi:predicted short-subunit dehydrogenase-like oxidoreductase (DUF2520 family)